MNFTGIDPHTNRFTKPGKDMVFYSGKRVLYPGCMDEQQFCGSKIATSPALWGGS
jgi:hypothetical protein